MNGDYGLGEWRNLDAERVRDGQLQRQIQESDNQTTMPML